MYVPNYQDTLKRKPKYTFTRILEIIFRHEPKFLNHIKTKVLKLEDSKNRKISFAEKYKQ